MAKEFTFELHYFMKAFQKSGIMFPISKEDAIAKAGDLTVRVDFDEYVTLSSIIEGMYLDYYENGAEFFSDHRAASLNAYKEKIGY